MVRRTMEDSLRARVCIYVCACTRVCLCRSEVDTSVFRNHSQSHYFFYVSVCGVCVHTRKAEYVAIHAHIRKPGCVAYVFTLGRQSVWHTCTH